MNYNFNNNVYNIMIKRYTGHLNILHYNGMTLKQKDNSDKKYIQGTCMYCCSLVIIRPDAIQDIIRCRGCRRIVSYIKKN